MLVIVNEKTELGTSVCFELLNMGIIYEKTEGGYIDETTSGFRKL